MDKLQMQNDYSESNYRRFKKTLKRKDEHQASSFNSVLNNYGGGENHHSESDQKAREIYDKIDSIERELLKQSKKINRTAFMPTS